ncbi:unnamed protein product [Ambrosiozyma monospora]|uniref:Unnamed protein product n=1 Tax=Ambrosiozyma monospora TaxID=43982 RepID=A0ACB5TA06_AMBMO|nr:unnamed protein product [Ambrosiozyma monospora]
MKANKSLELSDHITDDIISNATLNSVERKYHITQGKLSESYEEKEIAYIESTIKRNKHFEQLQGCSSHLESTYPPKAMVIRYDVMFELMNKFISNPTQTHKFSPTMFFVFMQFAYCTGLTRIE